MAEMLATDRASRFRHDLATSVNHIAGFASLWIEDSRASGRHHRINSLKSVKLMALTMLGQVDEELRRVDQDSCGSRPLPFGLRSKIRSTGLEIIEACRAIEEVSGGSPGQEEFLVDLARIALAAAQIVQLGEAFPGTALKS